MAGSLLSLIGAVVVAAAPGSPLFAASAGPDWLAYFFRPTLLSLGFALLVLGAVLSAGRSRAVWRVPVLRLLGVMSYSTYLWHLPILTTVGAVLVANGMMSLPILVLAAVPPVLLASAATYLCVEVPFMALGARLATALSDRPHGSPEHAQGAALGVGV
jgi:peptidoglycan/LPS O-acetylase OafA/YrhL